MRASILTLGLFAALGPVVEARALVVAPQPIATRIGQVDAVVVGRVAGIEPQDVMAAVGPGAQQKIAYRIALVAVGDNLRGLPEGTKTVRVGFIAPPMEVENGNPGAGIRVRPILSHRPMQLEVGNEGMLLLTKHPQEKFYTVDFGGFVSSTNNPNFNKEVENIKNLVKLSVNPQEGLASKNAETRLLAASVLISKYRTPRGSVKQEPVPAAESKQILLALADADWNVQGRFGDRPNPMILFNQLGITAKDGWQPRGFTNQTEVTDAMRAWLREHADTFCMQRFVVNAER